MVMLLSFFIAAFGLALLGVLLFRIKQVNHDIHLKKYRATDEGYADLLNAASVVDDGIILCKNGALMAAWLYEGCDASSSDESSIELVSSRINTSLKRLGSGWMIHVDAVRRQAPSYPEPSESDFPDALSKAIDEERRQLFESLGTMYEGYYVLTLSCLPKRAVEQRLINLMFDDDSPVTSGLDKTRSLIDSFKHAIEVFEGDLSSALTLLRLKSEKFESDTGYRYTHDNFLRWLHYCATGLNHPLQLPKKPSYIDAIIGGQPLQTGMTPKIGNKYVQCVAIEGFPSESCPGVLHALTESCLEYRWSTRFIFMDRAEAISHLEKYRKKWKQKVRGFAEQIFRTNSGFVNEDALMMVEEASSAIAETSNGQVGQGYYTSNVILMDEDHEQLALKAREIEEQINALGFSARIETINNLEAFLGSQPGHGYENIRRPLLNTLNLADLLPTSNIWAGSERSTIPGLQNHPAFLYGVSSGNTPWRLNLHLGELGHSLILGATRGGKSTLLAMLASQYRRYPGARLFLFDKGRSLLPITLGVGGAHYETSADSCLSLAPLSRLTTKEWQGFASGWIERILILNHLEVTADIKNAIDSAIQSMAESGAHSLSDFSLTIQNQEVREVLKQYCQGSIYGNLFDSETDNIINNDFVTFEIDALLKMPDKYRLPVFDYLFFCIEEVVKKDSNPSLVILDEAWVAFKDKAFREKLVDWLKTLAKSNTAVVMATQELADVVNSGMASTLRESIASTIFLPNARAKEEQSHKHYQSFGCNAREIDIIQQAVKNRDYYFKSNEGSRLFSMTLGPVALAFVGKTDLASLERIQALYQQHGEHWPDQWLQELNVDTDIESDIDIDIESDIGQSNYFDPVGGAA